jgi:Tol biopolymer transport system component
MWGYITRQAYFFRICELLLGVVLCTACTPPQINPTLITVEIETYPAFEMTPSPKPITVQLVAGSTVQDSLNKANAQLGKMDRVEPSSYTILRDKDKVSIIQAVEKFEIKRIDTPFERQTLRSLNLPEGETLLIQAGENGVQEITYREVYERNVEISNSQVKSVVIKEPIPQILMVGSQMPFTPFDIPGKLAYLSAGNAWVMDKSTAERRPLLTNGKLDGRVFSLSPDGNWLLFTQRAQDENNINSLFVIKTDGSSKDPLTLQVDNVVSYADWVPGNKLRVAFSTVEPRSAAPGWQSNNDLYFIDFSDNGWISQKIQILGANGGGVYGWWGTQFVFSPDGSKLIYSRPDEIGTVDTKEGILQPLVKITPLQTQGDWAWVPGVSWSPDGSMLYAVVHKTQGEETHAETSPLFDVSAVMLDGTTISMIPQAGMFAYPVPSPAQKQPTGENAYQLAYLQAIFANQSQTSRYRLIVADRDGSNKRTVFPTEGLPGIKPQWVVWSPQALVGTKEGKASSIQASDTGYTLALIYQDDIWFIDADTGTARQITGEGVITRIDWR